MMTDQAQKRYQTLGTCLTLIEANIRAFSRNLASQEALEGYETAFQAEKDKAECIREMMREVRYGK